MALYFISGNQGKVNEIKESIPSLENIALDLLEIQSLDPQEIIAGKLKEATRQRKGAFFVEDTSLYLDCLNGFPGPLIKWLLERLGAAGVADLVHHYDDHGATAKTVIGYSDGRDIHFFTGEVRGTIVLPKGKNAFGWDPIFLPKGYTKTFAEMTLEEKNKISHRRKAVMKLKEFLTQR